MEVGECSGLTDKEAPERSEASLGMGVIEPRGDGVGSVV